jgi:hypothetical protein
VKTERNILHNNNNNNNNKTSQSVIVKKNMFVNKQWSFRNINVITIEAEKKAETKYMECTTTSIPVIRGSIGTFSKSFKKYLNTI